MVHIKNWHHAVITGIAQIAFSEKILSGYLIFFSILVISPLSALGCLVGSIFGNIIFQFLRNDLNDHLFSKGFYGYAPGILGIIIGGYLGADKFYIIIFLVGIVFCSFFDFFLKKIFLKFQLPSLATSTIISAWIIYFILKKNGMDFWVFLFVFPFDDISRYLCIFGVFLSLFITNPRATVLTVFFALLSIYFSKIFMNLSLNESSGLWAFTVSTTTFISSIFFLQFGIFGTLIIFLTVILSSTIWFFWITLNFWELLPALIAPFTLSILVVSVIMNKIFGPIIYQSNIWNVVEKIKKIKKNICVLTGAGTSTPSGIPDYVSGEWINKSKNISDYDFENFLKKKTSRKAYWEVCYKFFKISNNAKPNIIHKVLSKLEKKKVVNSIITQNVDGLHQLSGSKNVIELHGNISSSSCLQCNKNFTWSKINKLWRKKDILCDCNSFVKPSVIAMKQDLNPIVWKKARNSIMNSKLLLILGTQLAISSAITLVNEARKRGNQVIVINNSSIAIPLKKNEIVLYYPIEKFFKILSVIKFL